MATSKENKTRAKVLNDMADKKDSKSSDPIHLNPKNKGALHSMLGVPQGQPIPSSKLNAALNSKNPTERKRAQFAKNAKSWSHGGNGKSSKGGS